MNTPPLEFLEKWPKIGLAERISTLIRTILRARKYRASFEAQELKALFEFMPPGGCAIDIGAYKGAWTYWMQEIAGKKWKVVAFEPQFDAVSQLRKIQSIFNWSQVCIEPSGVWEKNCLLPLYRELRVNSPSQWAQFESTHTDMKCIGHVSVVQLDDYKTKNKIPRINFIKIDAEGFERKIIHWAKGIFREDRPTIVVECDANFVGDREQQLFFREMKEFWYEWYFFTKNGRQHIDDFDYKKHQRNDLPKWLSDPAYYNNFLFTPQK